MALDKNKLSKLSPEERIKKLKQLEEDRKKEAVEIEQLIKSSMQELRTGKLADEITPEHRVVDISRLFEMRREEGLESAAREAQSAEIPKGTKEYQIFARTYEDYSQLKAFSGIVSVGGNLSDEQMAEVGKIGERVNIAEKYKTEGETVANILDASKAILYKFEKEKGFG